MSDDSSTNERSFELLTTRMSLATEEEEEVHDPNRNLIEGENDDDGEDDGGGEEDDGEDPMIRTWISLSRTFDAEAVDWMRGSCT